MRIKWFTIRKMLSTVPACHKYYICSLKNMYIHTWGGMTFFTVGPRTDVRDRSKEGWRLFLCYAVQHCMNTCLPPRRIFKYNQLLVPGAPPGGGCGNIGPQNLTQASRRSHFMIRFTGTVWLSDNQETSTVWEKNISSGQTCKAKLSPFLYLWNESQCCLELLPIYY